MIGGERGYHRHATVMTSRAASAETETLRVAMNRARGSSSWSFCAHCGDPCLVLARAHATTKHHGNVPCLVHPSMHVCDRRQKVTGPKIGHERRVVPRNERRVVPRLAWMTGGQHSVLEHQRAPRCHPPPDAGRQVER